MNLDNVRMIIKEYLNIPCYFTYTGTRNQIEEFSGKIINCYHSIFVVETTEKVIKAFSYNDYIMKNIKIISL